MLSLPKPSVWFFTRTLALLAAIGAIGTLLNLNDEPKRGPTETADLRQLRVLDPKTVEARIQPPDGVGPLSVNIYLASPQPDIVSKLFHTDVFLRYTTGRIDFNVVEFDWVLKSHVVDETKPCIAVGGGYLQEDYDSIKEKYQHCKIMTATDERCKAVDDWDVRHYYNSDLSAYYLPLGMRWDSWSSLGKIRAHQDFVMKPPSQRKYAFNAMFSKSTNHGRIHISNVLEENSGNTMSTYVKLKDRWSGKEHGPNFTDQYMNVLVESAFTISPDGANPECFRMYEAIEAGSIPVMQKGRASGPHGQAHRCRLAMKYWYSSPVVLLDSWDDLYPTIQKLIDDPVKLDELYIKVRSWYDDYMGTAITGFEDYIIGSYAQDEAGRAVVGV